MNFTRFGNAFVAQLSVASGEEKDTLYVVSLYNDGWSANYRTADMDHPQEVQPYGFGFGQSGLDQARAACEAHFREKVS
jgi:hypothetical protein